MIDLGPHAVFILGAYAAALAITAGVIALVVADARRQKARLAGLEAQGVRRRSEA